MRPLLLCSMRDNFARIPLPRFLIAFFALLFLALPLAAQRNKSVITKGPYTWADDCGETMQFKVTIDTKPAGLKGLYKLDYEVTNVNVHGQLPDAMVDGVADIELTLAAPTEDPSVSGVDIGNLYTPLGWDYDAYVWTAGGWQGEDTPPQGAVRLLELYSPHDAMDPYAPPLFGLPPGYTGCWSPTSVLKAGQTAHFGFTTAPRAVFEPQGDAYSIQPFCADACPPVSPRLCGDVLGPIAVPGDPLLLSGGNRQGRQRSEHSNDRSGARS